MPPYPHVHGKRTHTHTTGQIDIFFQHVCKGKLANLSTPDRTRLRDLYERDGAESVHFFDIDLGSCRCLNSPTCASQPWCARNGTPLSTGRLCSWTLFTSRSALTSNAPTAHAICTLGYCLQQAQFDPTTRCDMHKSSAYFHAQVPNVVSARDFHSASSDTSGLLLT